MYDQTSLYNVIICHLANFGPTMWVEHRRGAELSFLNVAKNNNQELSLTQSCVL